MTVTYSRSARPEAGDVAELYRRAGLRRPVDDVDRIGRMLTNSNLIVTAWDGERLVGIARSVTDFAYCCYLSDMAVDPDYQGQGIGRELVRQTQEAAGDESMVLLLAAPNAQSYYPHIGFQWVDNAWRLPRKR